jgi:DNA-binding NtrC family response regulator
MAEDVLESELFGHAAGAFTGAAQASKGLFRSAHGGTLFLDEIGSASPKVQGTLLRVIEDGVVRPLGSDEDHKVDVRLISATNEDLEDLVASGSFRDDLFYRLNALTIVLPPLRERRDDIPLLARHFVLEALGKDEDRADDVLTRTVVARLLARDWPGNVRELKNTIETLVSLGELPAAEKRVRRREIATGTPVWKEIGEPVPTLREAEFRTICAALTACEGNKLKAARMLGISRRGLYYLLEAHGLDGEIVRRD